MEAVVGGRIETVAPKPVTDQGDRRGLFVLLLFAILLHGWILQSTSVTARDSIGFARQALTLIHPNLDRPADEPRRSLEDALREAHHPPGFPMLILFIHKAHKLVSPVELDELPARVLWDTQLASIIPAVLMIFPTYALGRKLFGRFAGFAAAALFQFLPVVAQTTSDGLSQGPFLFGVALSLFLGTRAVSQPTVGKFLLCGLSTGCTYLIRPEGALVGLACVAVLGLWLIRGTETRSAILGWLTALAIGGLLPAVPYMAMIGGVTNKPSPRGVWQRLINPRGEIMGQWEAHKDARRVQPTVPFAAWYTPEKGSKLGWAFVAVSKETSKTLHYLPGLFAIIGLISIWPKLRNEPKYWLPLLYGLGNLMVLFFLAYTVGYVSERHTLPVVFVSVLFAGGGLAAWAEWSVQRTAIGRKLGSRLLRWGMLLLILASCLPNAIKPLHDHRAGHIGAGKYLAEHAQKEDAIIDPFEWAQFYSGRTLFWIPPDPPNPPRVWVVLEESKDHNPHSRLPRLDLAIDIAHNPLSKVVWEEESADGKKFVRVYLYQEPGDKE